jgi:hypothetical protein
LQGKPCVFLAKYPCVLVNSLVLLVKDPVWKNSLCCFLCWFDAASQGTGELQEEQHEKTQSGLLCPLIGAILARTFRAFGSVCELGSTS